MTTNTTKKPARTGGRLPPRPVIRAAWAIHRGLFRMLGRRRALRPVSEKTWGMMRLKTVGRKSGQERAAILGYYEDGPNLVTMAMNGWGAPEPAWWLNLQAHPDTTVELPTERWPSTAAPRPRRSGPACGSCGADTTARRWTAGPRVGRARRRSSSSNPAEPRRVGITWSRPAGRR
jgi:deazaflavin-dependent oxidoreductase (nitroreductase family)